MGPSDVPACVSILAQHDLFRRYEYTAGTARRMFEYGLKDGRSEISVAVLRGAVVGFSWFVPRGAFDHSGYLRLIAVDRSRHGEGIGRKMMDRIEKRHVSRGGVVLLASSFNTGAHRFYEGLGYACIGEIPDYVRKGITERIYFKPPPFRKSPASRRR